MKTKRRKSPPSKRIPLAQRVIVESLHRYLREESRAAGKGHTVAARKRFAKRCGTSMQYLTQLALGIRHARPDIAIRIEQASYGLVRAEDLCSEFDWHYAKLRGVRPRRVEPPERESARSNTIDEQAAVA